MSVNGDKKPIMGGKRKIGDTVTPRETIDFGRQKSNQHLLDGFNKNSKTTKRGGRIRTRRADKKRNRSSKRRHSKTLSKH
jgi:hypothetical protein